MGTASISDAAHSDREHSDIVGGSSADRILNCPGSYRKLMALPEEARNTSSVYADEGTALHEAMATLLDDDLEPEDVLGRVFNSTWMMSPALVADALEPCVDFFDALDAEADAEGGLQFLVEKRCQLPGIPGAFGTADLICRSDRRSYVIDWKFGVGKQVKASYPTESGGVRANSQLMFYARAAMHSYPEMFQGDDPDWPVELYIVQPRSRDLGPDDPVFSHFTVTVRDLETFRFQLIAAVAEAQGREPRTKRGPWCDFMACRATCPHHTGPLLDLSKLDRKGLDTKAADVDWGEVFGVYLDACDIAEGVIAEVRKQAHAYLEAGRPVDGYKLVEKRATENYADPEGAKRHAIGLGCDADAVMTEPELKSPAQLAAVMEPLVDGSTKKARTEEARKQIAAFTQKVSSGTTLARDADGRPDVTPTPTLLKNLADRLAKL